MSALQIVKEAFMSGKTVISSEIAKGTEYTRYDFSCVLHRLRQKGFIEKIGQGPRSAKRGVLPVEWCCVDLPGLLKYGKKEEVSEKRDATRGITIRRHTCL